MIHGSGYADPASGESGYIICQLVYNDSDSKIPRFNSSARFRWFRNGVEIFTKPGKYNVTDEYVEVLKVDQADVGPYTCQLANSSMTANVSIDTVPVLETNLIREQNITIGSNLTLDCKAWGYPTPRIEWAFRFTNISEGTLYNISVIESPNNTLTVGSRLSVNSITLANAGTYQCKAVTEKFSSVRYSYVNVLDYPTTTVISKTTPFRQSSASSSVRCSYILTFVSYILLTLLQR
jgi:hypothetical protein